MAISQYWVGQIPSRPMAIDVRDSIGRPMNLSTYPVFNVILLGSDNEEIDLTGSTLTTTGSELGRFVFRFPQDRSVFDKPGEYLLQMEIIGANGSRDYTTEHHIKVRRLGGNK